MGDRAHACQAHIGAVRPTVSSMEFTGVGVHLKVHDITASRHFYEQVLGMVPARASGSPEFRSTLPVGLAPQDDGLPGSPDRWNSISYKPCPNTEIELADSHPAVPERSVFESEIQTPKISAMLHVESLLPLIRDRGVRPTYPLRAYPWGSVEAVLKDPDGFVVVLIAASTDPELQALRDIVEVEVFPPEN